MAPAAKDADDKTLVDGAGKDADDKTLVDGAGKDADDKTLVDDAEKFASAVANQNLTAESIINFLRSHRHAEGGVLGGVSAWLGKAEPPTPERETLGLVATLSRVVRRCF